MKFMTIFCKLLISIVGYIAKYILALLGREIGYLMFCNGNIKNLEKEMYKLNERKKTIDLQVDDAERNLRIPPPEMKTWQEKVKDINGRAHKFLEEEIKRNRKCLYDLCPNPKSLYSLSRDATKMKQEILVLLNEAEKFSLIDLPAPPPALGPIFNTEDTKEFESRNSIMNNILEALRNDSASMMSICGPGGVGKTTMVGKLVEFIEREKFFEVAMAVVSQNPDLKKIQGDIASCLGLKFQDENEQERAQKLHERIIIKSEKKILLILDDVWTEMDFLRLQLPSAGKRVGYKILLTSRREDECRKVGCLNFRVVALSKEEGWNLFNGIALAGHSIDNQDNLHQLAKQIADECDGLPLVIVAIAKALKGRDVRTWANALTKLQSNNLKGISGVDEKVCLRLELSYNLIQSEEAKACFLLCCLFPEDNDIPIEVLVRYAVGLRLLGSFETISEARNSVYALIGELKESSLLLDGNDDEVECVRMHDVFRDVAISIAKTYLVSCDNMMNCWPNRWIGRYDDCTAISLFNEKIEEYPSDLKCPKLQILQLRSRSLPITFFEGMEGLKVVALEGCFPPVSLNAAKEVRTLRLSNVESTSKIEKLMNVEILEIWTCGELPNGVGLMRNLRLLDLSVADSLEYIPAGILSGLSNLEELYVSLEFAKWEARVDGERMNASLKELDSRHMTTLEVGVSNISHLPKSSILDKIIKFKIRVGFSRIISQEPGNALILTGDASEIVRSGICVLLKRTEHLQLENVHNLKNGLHVLGDHESFPELKTLQMSKCDDIERLVDENKIKDGCFRMLREVNIKNCKKLEYMFPTTMTTRLSQSLQSIDIESCENMEAIFNGKEEGNDVEFPKLKVINLYDLPNLKALWMYKSNDHQLVKSNCMEQPISILFPSSWIITANLKKLSLRSCHSLKVVFSTSAARQLQHLQILGITNCKKVEYIVGGEEGNTNNTFIFPMLTKVLFYYLPELVSFCVHSHIFMDWSSLEDIHVNSCSEIQTIIGYIQGPSALDKKQILFKIPAELKQPLKVKEVDVYGCDSLMHVFTSLVAKLLVKLEDMTITRNRNMEQVIAKEEGEEEAIGITEIIEFSHLKSIKLYVLDNMRCFYGGSHAMECPLLESLNFRKCSSMKTFSCGSSLSTPKLKSVKVDDIDIDLKSDLNTIVRQEKFEKVDIECTEDFMKICQSTKDLRNIKCLCISFCHWSLNAIFSISMVKDLVQLEELKIRCCDGVEQIVANDEDDEEEEITHKIVFPKLRRIDISYSIEGSFGIKCFYSGMYALDFPLLESLSLDRCYKMTTFSSGSLTTPALQKLWINEKDYPCTGDLNKDLKDKMLERVDVGGYENFVRICQTAEECSIGIRSLRIQHSDKLFNEIPCSVIQNLEELHVDSCESVKTIFELNKQTTFSSLAIIKLEYLHDLKHIFFNIPKGFAGFQQLTRLEVEFSNRLEYVFPVSIVRGLPQLQLMRIFGGSGMEQIIGEKDQLGEEESITQKIVLPQLQSISVAYATALKCFYNGICDIEFPLLETLIIDRCDNMKTFSNGSVSTPKLQTLQMDEEDYPYSGNLNDEILKRWHERNT